MRQRSVDAPIEGYFSEKVRFNPETRPAPSTHCMRPARITGGSQDESEHPRLTEFVTLASAEAERSVFDSAGEAIQNHRIALAVDDVFNFTDPDRGSAGAPRCGQVGGLCGLPPGPRNRSARQPAGGRSSARRAGGAFRKQASRCRHL